MLAVFLVLLAIWFVITIAAIIMIPGDPALEKKCFVSTRFCAYCGKETLTEQNDCQHCHSELVCDIVGHY